MSGIFKSIGRALKKVWKSPIFKAIVIAAAIYFTAGVGLAAMGVEAAAALPGITAVGQAVGLGGVGAIAAAGEAVAGAVTAAATAGIEVASTAGGMGLEAGIGSAAMATGNAAAISTATLGAAGTNVAGAAVKTGVAGWWGGLSPGTQQIISNGVVEGGKAILKGIGEKDASDLEREKFDYAKSLHQPTGVLPKGPAPIVAAPMVAQPAIVDRYTNPTAQEGAGLSDSDVSGLKLSGAGQTPQPTTSTQVAPATFDPSKLKKSQFSNTGAQ